MNPDEDTISETSEIFEIGDQETITTVDEFEDFEKFESKTKDWTGKKAVAVQLCSDIEDINWKIDDLQISLAENLRLRDNAKEAVVALLTPDELRDAHEDFRIFPELFPED